METVKISSKYQVVIPSSVRKELNLKPGQRVSVRSEEGVLKIVPVPSVEQMHGMAKGINTDGLREKKDRF